MPQFQYKQQQFQQDAVNAVADMFRGVDISRFQRPEAYQLTSQTTSAPAPANRQRPYDFMRQYFLAVLRDNLKKIQERNNLRPTPFDSSGDYLVLDTQMETGTGKTFTFINAIFELHKQYDLTHFIIIVPSIAIKEGIKKTFDTTRPYFERLYQQRIQVYEMGASKGKKGRKSPPAGVTNFIHSQSPIVLIMTNHAFNSASNIINQELEGFHADNARTSMDAIAAKAPVLIIDEPQRAGEGTRTVERLKNFNPLFALRYSATFRDGQLKNPVYVLDSYDAFEKKLVKSITVTDYQVGPTDAEFLGVRRLFADSAEAELEAIAANGEIRRIRTGIEAENSAGKIFEKTQNPAYRNLRVTKIDWREKTVTFSDNRTLSLGEYSRRESKNDEAVAEVMLRDMIDRHLRKERDLFTRNIKCLSLIFVDKVKDYRDDDSADGKGYLQELFERCYAECKQRHIASENLPADYRDRLNQWAAATAHGGYFSGDAKRNKKIDAGAAEGNNETARALQQEISELILRDKEKILNPANELRFIFAHSALREGWDNPNVFQICKLRTGYSETNIVQEVGRGLRICVNGSLIRQDEDTIGGEFAALNHLDVFTVGQGKFIGELQQELSDRRSDAKAEFSQILAENLWKVYGITNDMTYEKAVGVWCEIRKAGCIDENGYLQSLEQIEGILTSNGLSPKKLFDTLSIRLPMRPKVGNSRTQQHKPREYKASKWHYQRFKELWELLHQNVIYEVKYSEDFEDKAVEKIDALDSITPLYITHETTGLQTQEGEFTQTGAQQSTSADAQQLTSDISARAFLRQLAEKTDLPRNSIIRILGKVSERQFKAMQQNPFLAIEEVSKAINSVIYQNIVDNIRYHKVDGLRGETTTTITLTDREPFTAMEYLELKDLPNYKNNNLWEEIAPYDSEDPERKISEEALAEDKITVFAKLPRIINIPTPMHDKGINPDFAFIVEKENEGKRFYFIAEAKPTTDISALRDEEEQRIAFTKKYFEGIDNADIQFKVVSNYAQLLQWFEQTGAV